MDAPYTGARIETIAQQSDDGGDANDAPYTGARIETDRKSVV